MSDTNGKIAHEAAVGGGDGGEDVHRIVASCTCSLFDGCLVIDVRCFNFYLRISSSGSFAVCLDDSRTGIASLPSLDDVRLPRGGVLSFSLP